MPYQVADAYDNEGGLAALSVQPKSTPIDEGRLRENGDGVVIEDGKPSQIWRFSFLTYSDYETVMTELGLLNVRSGKKTITTRKNKDSSFVNYNAVLTRKDGDRSQVGGYENVIIRVTGMVAL